MPGNGRNFVCVGCGADAELQCPGCPTGAQIYCGRCAIEHVKKGGAHTLLSIDIPISSPEEASSYHSRFQQITRLLGTLDIAEQVITTEEANLQIILSQQLQTQIQTLHNAYWEIENDLKGYYSRLKVEVGRVRAELHACSTSISALSDNTEAFIMRSAHIEPRGEILQREIAGRLPAITYNQVPFPGQNELLMLCEAWGGRTCTCEICTNLQTTLLQLSSRTVRRATTTPPAPINSLTPAPGAYTTQWSCLKCNYFNSLQVAACSKCHLKRGLENYLLKMGVIMDSERKQWKCGRCGKLMLLSKSQCVCGSVNAILASALSRS